MLKLMDKKIAAILHIFFFLLYWPYEGQCFDNYGMTSCQITEAA